MASQVGGAMGVKILFLFYRVFHDQKTYSFIRWPWERIGCI